MSAPLQCQVEAARFASTAETVDELGAKARRKAIERLRDGDGAGALAEMYAGLKAQAPLSFTPPAVTR